MAWITAPATCIHMYYAAMNARTVTNDGCEGESMHSIVGLKSCLQCYTSQFKDFQNKNWIENSKLLCDQIMNEDIQLKKIFSLFLDHWVLAAIMVGNIYVSNLALKQYQLDSCWCCCGW